MGYKLPVGKPAIRGFLRESMGDYMDESIK